MPHIPHIPHMPRIDIYLPEPLLQRVDNERRLVPRSKAIRLLLEYLLQQPGFLAEYLGVLPQT